MSLNLIPHTSTPLPDLLTRAAFAPLPNIGWLRVTGEDRIRWLNGMASNNIAALTPGEGCYNFFLNAQGRILGDATAWLLEDSILLETSIDQLPTLVAHLEHFIIMDDVELKTIRDYEGILLTGPRATELLHLAAPSVAPADGLRQLLYDPDEDLDHPLQVLQPYSPLAPAYEIWSNAEHIESISGLFGSLNTIEAAAATLEQLRILSGTPLYGTDIRNTDTAKDLPQETAQTRALHFTKGCYLGQEIVERIRSRGAVHRTFTGFILDGPLPTPGTHLFATDATLPARPIGELTSVTTIDGRHIALGYIRRDALDLHKSIQYPGGTATPTDLPFPTESLNRAETHVR